MRGRRARLGALGGTLTFVHEIGHGYGFDHTPSGNVGTPDPMSPTYEPYFSASIGEYGTDIQNGTIYDPAVSTDYMSYGPNRWMSLYRRGFRSRRSAAPSIRRAGRSPTQSSDGCSTGCGSRAAARRSCASSRASTS